MSVRKIKSGVHSVGAIDWDRRLAVFLVNTLRPKLRYASVIGSYGWGGRMLDQIKGMLTNIKLDFIEPVIVRGYPKEEDFSLLEKLADEILEKHRELGIA